ncbi:conserved exported hypothetical protein [Erythrobacter sp. EC-HK427]|nr:conserved exported hypothetical protein [Erythrobacter sp. EC-HK427]
MSMMKALLTAAALLAAPAAMAQDENGAGEDAEGSQPAKASCDGIEFRAFDFWIGRWTVANNGEALPFAMNHIESVAEGCVIRETYTPMDGPMGVSMTTLEPDTGVWHQQWVGGVPGRVHFQGGPVGDLGDTMVLTGFWGTDNNGVPRLVRMTYTYREDGTVRQLGEASSDQGTSWQVSFDLIYTPYPPQ